jgi:hypothetical protein
LGAPSAPTFKWGTARSRLPVYQVPEIPDDAFRRRRRPPRPPASVSTVAPTIESMVRIGRRYPVRFFQTWGIPRAKSSRASVVSRLCRRIDDVNADTSPNRPTRRGLVHQPYRNKSFTTLTPRAHRRAFSRSFDIHRNRDQKCRMAVFTCPAQFPREPKRDSPSSVVFARRRALFGHLVRFASPRQFFRRRSTGAPRESHHHHEPQQSVSIRYPCALIWSWLWSEPGGWVAPRADGRETATA